VRKLIIVFVLLTAASFGYYLFRAQLGPDKVDLVSSASISKPLSESTISKLPVDTKAPNPDATKSSPDIAPLAKQLYLAKDYQAFIRQARARPQEGGSYMSYALVSFCRGASQKGMEYRLSNLANDTKKSSSTKELQVEAIRMMHAKCLGANGQSFDASEFQGIMEEGLRKGDPIFALPAQISDASKTGTLDQLFAKVVASKNPYMAEVFFSQVFVPSAEADVLIDGKKISVDDQVQFNAALELTQCALGKDCTRGSIINMRWCADNGECSADSTEFWRRRMLTPDQWEQALSYYGQIMTGLRAGNYGVLSVKSPVAGNSIAK
jgi:hypothetical protein